MQIYEGKAKKVQDLGNQQVRLIFKDDLTAFDGVKHETKTGKGLLNKKITVKLFQLLQAAGIPTHFIKDEGENTNAIIAKKVEIIPLEVVIRNKVAGSFMRRYGIEKGKEFDTPVFELFLKNDELHDPLITEHVAVQLRYVTPWELELIKLLALNVNAVLKTFFERMNLELIDFKIEIGRTEQGEIVVADEITPDTMRLWKKGTQESWDKDVFREDKGDVLSVYEQLWELIKKQSIPNDFEFMFHAQLVVHLKEGIMDAQGQVTKRALQRMGLHEIKNAHIGKSIILDIQANNLLKLQEKLGKAIDEFLINPLIEKYEVTYYV